MSIPYEAIIIGSGQAGPPLAGRLTAAGMKVAIIERGLFGGTCVNTGCIPTKTMVASAYAAHLASRAAEFGVVTGTPVAVDMKRVKARKDAISGKSNHSVESGLRKIPNCTVYQGHARFESSHEVSVGDVRLTADKIFVNVGGRAAVGRAVEKGETLGLVKVLIDADTQRIMGAAILGTGGDEVIHSILDVMYADKPYTMIQRAMHIHPTVSELIPTTLGELKSLDASN